MTIQAFVDDSVSQVDGRNLVLAGYVHAAEKWLHFSDDWKRTLDSKPRIDYFRMVEAQNLNGQFRNWVACDRDAKVESLGKVIYDHNPWSFECSVSQEAFDRIVKPVAPYDLKNPYMVCFYGAIVTLARYHEEYGVTTPVDFTFDEQGPLGPFVVFWYEWIKEWQDPKISALLGITPVFQDDKKVLPLQAADLLAWHLRRRKESRHALESRPIMDYIFGNHVEANITEDVLQLLAQRMSAVPGVKEVQAKKSSIRALLKRGGRV